MNAKWMVSVVIVAAAMTLAPGRAQAVVGKTQVLIGAAAYSGGPPINTATVTISLEIDSSVKSFTNYSVSISDVTFPLFPRPVPFTQTFPPNPRRPERER